MKFKPDLEQIFLYVTFKCNCKCITCYIRNHYSTVKEIPISRVKKILRKYHLWGAYRLTLLGGEPTLYQNIFEVVKYAKSTGYNYVRIQTNGQFNTNFLKHSIIQDSVDTFSFSIDGATEESNQKIRIGCRLDKTLTNMMEAKKNGYDVRVNVTINSLNVDRIFDIIKLMLNVGPSTLYLNLVFPMGGAASKPNLVITQKQWVPVYELIKEKLKDSKIKIKVPVGFSKSTPEDHRCIAVNPSRLYIMPNSDAYPCILFIDDFKLRFEGRVTNNPSEKILNHYKTIENKINDYCPALKRLKKGEWKPLCLYCRRIIGGG